MDDQKLKDILSKAKTIAIVGAKDDPGTAVNNVGRYLIKAGYTIYPVHPTRKEVWGLPAYPSLAAIPGDVDVIDLFRSSEYCQGHAAEACSMQCTPKLFWMQLGIANEEAARTTEGKGIPAMEDACLMVEHARLFRETPMH